MRSLVLCSPHTGLNVSPALPHILPRIPGCRSDAGRCGRSLVSDGSQTPAGGQRDSVCRDVQGWRGQRWRVLGGDGVKDGALLRCALGFVPRPGGCC